jgi:hypothetical protein
MTVTTPSARRRWTDAQIEDELRDCIAQLGEFPSRPQLIALGRRSLWEAMRRRGGAEAWRERFAESPRHEEIAQRAYLLWEAGADGDSVSHWLSAERQLAGVG